MKEAAAYSPKDLVADTILQHQLHTIDQLTYPQTQTLEEMVSSQVAPEILSSIKGDLGEELWGQMLFALHQTKRWGRDKALDALNYEDFGESNLEHSVGMIRRMNQLFQHSPDLEQYIGSKRDFVIGILLHDLPEALVGDMPAFGNARDSDLGQQVKRMESLVFTFLMAPRIENQDLRNHWLGIYRDVTNNKTDAASPRARMLRFLDKWDGTANAHEHFYRYATQAVTDGKISKGSIDDHVTQSLVKTADAARRAHQIFSPSHQIQFASFIDTVVNPQFLQNYRPSSITLRRGA